MKPVMLTVIAFAVFFLCTACTGNDPISNDGNISENEPTEGEGLLTEEDALLDSEELLIDDEVETSDQDIICTPNAFLRCVEGDDTKEVKCAASGKAEEEKDCPPSFVCMTDLGCRYPLCTPGSPVCDPAEDPAAVYECDETGLAHNPDPIDICDTLTGEKCMDGQCMTPCEAAAFEKSYEGCDFFTANLRNATEWRTDPIYTITVANTNETMTATIDITISDDGTTELDAGLNYFCVDNVIDCQTMTTSKGLVIGPKQLGIIRYPHDRMITAAGISFLSYHIVSDTPISAYQFNPFDNSKANPFNPNGLSESVVEGDNQKGRMYSNDASLLLPTSSLYTDYIVSSYYTNSLIGMPSYATVIGFNPTEIEIEVNPPVTLKGIGNGISSFPASTWTTLKLKRFQTIQLETQFNGNEKGPDITGTRIRCKTPDSATCAPFVVFGGHVCTNIPADMPTCDHLEHQMLPVQIWGKQYAVAKTNVRGETDYDLVRIIASEDGTTINYAPFLPGPLDPYTTETASTQLNAQGWTEFYIRDPLFITADKPIMVVQYLSSISMTSTACFEPNSGCVGDPAMMVLPPIEQYREHYIFLTPGSYVANYATIVMPKGVTATLNGTAVTDLVDIAGTNYRFAAVDIGGSEFKRNELACSAGCGLFVYGWEEAVSYAYTGGLDLRDISQQ